MPALADQVADRNGAELYRICTLYGDAIPEFVRNAGVEKTLRPGPLKVAHYADPVRRQFPCHTAPSTFVSAAFYFEKKAEFHPKDQARIEQRLDHWVNFWQIKAAFDKWKARYDELHKEAEAQLPDSTYAYVWVAEDGSKERRLPMRNAVETKAAADYVWEYRDRIPYEDRQVMCGRILEKAARFGASVSGRLDWLERQAGRGVCDPDEVARLLEGRAKLASDNPDFRGHIRKLALSVKSTPHLHLTGDRLVKLAQTVYQIDRCLGLRNYSDLLPRPEDVIFKTTFVKAAADIASVVATTTGNVYRKDMLAKVAVDDVRGLFGDDFADQVAGADGKVDPEKAAELVHTLPRPDAELFDRMMADCGLRPELQKAASAPVGFTKEQLAELGKHYKV